MYYTLYYGLYQLDGATLLKIWWISVAVLVVLGNLAAFLVKTMHLHDIPTLEDYVRRNPSTRTSRGICCAHCRSHGIYLWFAEGRSRGFGARIHICRTCGQNLYRT